MLKNKFSLVMLVYITYEAGKVELSKWNGRIYLNLFYFKIFFLSKLLLE